LSAAARLLASVWTPACLLQVLVWAGLAAAIGFAFTCRRLEMRLWVWALAFAAVFAAYRIVPISVWGYPASLAPLLLNVVLAAGVIVLPLVLASGNVPEERDDEHLQGD